MITYSITEYFNESKHTDTTYRFSDGRTYRVNYKVDGRQRETVTWSTKSNPYKFLRSERSALDNRIANAELTGKTTAERINGACYVDGSPVAMIPRRPDLKPSATFSPGGQQAAPVLPPVEVLPTTNQVIPWRELCETIVQHGGAVEIHGVKIAKIRPNGFTDEGNQIKGLEARLANAEAKAEYLQRQLDTYAANRAFDKLKHEAAVSHVDAHIDGSLFDGLSKVEDK